MLKLSPPIEQAEAEGKVVKKNKIHSVRIAHAATNVMSDEATKVTGKSNSISHKNGSHKRTYVMLILLNKIYLYWLPRDHGRAINTVYIMQRERDLSNNWKHASNRFSDGTVMNQCQ